jgi:hypothetical protein
MLDDGAQFYTIEQTTNDKLQVIGDSLIVAGSGYGGYHQRFIARTAIEKGKMLSAAAIADFAETDTRHIGYSALVAYSADGRPCLCEFRGRDSRFQPEQRHVGDLWFTSAGRGQHILDPLLALSREIFWRDEPPNLQGGISTALWALRFACRVLRKGALCEKAPNKSGRQPQAGAGAPDASPPTGHNRDRPKIRSKAP